MKTITKYISIFVLTAFSLSSCLGDLNTDPLDEKLLTNEQTYSTVEGYMGVFAKCYASLTLTGQFGPDDKGVSDFSEAIDEGYSGYTRALYYLQNACTDEAAFQSGSSQGSLHLLNLSWDQGTNIISFAYYRLFVAIKYCNEFLRESTDDLLKSRGVYDDLKNDIEYFRAEVRFIRAYCYSQLCDLYGSVPFVDETMETGEVPQQKTREEIYNYAVSELEELKDKMVKVGKRDYGRLDEAAAWFLLARIYLNSEVYVGKNEYQKAYEYAKKVIESNAYPLAPDYRHNFFGDNDTCTEIIWQLVQDKDHARSSAGTNFMIKAFTNGTNRKYYSTGLSSDWGNARALTTMVKLFNEEDQAFRLDDPYGDTKGDKRAQFFSGGTEDDTASHHTLETWVEGVGFSTSGFNLGYSFMKWRSVTKDGEPLEPGGALYSSVDFPIFRSADAYLMAAEALLRGAGNADRTEALRLVNIIRDRAYMYEDFEVPYAVAVNGRITDEELDLDFILAERGRELHTELIRRTDLIRFGKFTKGYNWDWKGGNNGIGAHVGQDVDDKYNLFPLPQNELLTNPNLTQNPNYK